jgi:hypothetical protein
MPLRRRLSVQIADSMHVGHPAGVSDRSEPPDVALVRKMNGGLRGERRWLSFCELRCRQLTAAAAVAQCRTALRSGSVAGRAAMLSDRQPPPAEASMVRLTAAARSLSFLQSMEA